MSTHTGPTGSRRLPIGRTELLDHPYPILGLLVSSRVRVRIQTGLSTPDNAILICIEGRHYQEIYRKRYRQKMRGLE